ncbi:MAG: hypothetical protein LBQ38_09970 [Spirochaetaceae bacterium]|jgi:hypothetical protein|nr:hypothetical protein [Spirochaetaceae bacterium]
MNHIAARRITARFVFFIGLLLMLLGSGFLLGMLADASRDSVLFAFLFVLLGSGFTGLAVWLNKRSLYLFFAAFFLLTGFFLFFLSLKIIPLNFSEVWPLLSVFAGFALLPAGWHRYGRIQSRYVVPAAAFIILGGVLLVFSLDVVSFSFAQFIKNWWPLLVALSGLFLVLLSLGSKNKTEDLRP